MKQPWWWVPLVSIECAAAGVALGLVYYALASWTFVPWLAHAFVAGLISWGTCAFRGLFTRVRNAAMQDQIERKQQALLDETGVLPSDEVMAAIVRDVVASRGPGLDWHVATAMVCGVAVVSAAVILRWLLS